MPRSSPATIARAERRLLRTVTAVASVIGAVVLYVIVSSVLAPKEASVFDPSLPNPMGGLARTAPGDASGAVEVGGLTVRDAEVAMGEVALGVTYVPDWSVTNPTDQEITLVVGQPQVRAGCCPGPVYADGELTGVGQSLPVPPGGAVQLQFPLQMHLGMHGWHDLAIPLEAGGEQASLVVTGEFDPDASVR